MAYDPTNEESQILGARVQSLNTYRQLLGQRDGKLAAARDTIGPASDRWKRVEDKLYEAAADTRSINAKLGRLTDGNQVSSKWFLGAAIIFALLEAPINKFMLDNILRGSNFDSYAISVFVTFALLALAHHAGHQLRQFRDEHEEKIYFSKIVVATIILLILASCVGVGRWDSKDRRPLSVKELNKLLEFWNAYLREAGAVKVGISQNPL